MGITIITSVGSGQTQNFVTLTNGVQLLVYGTAINTQIQSGGIQYVLSGGAAQQAGIFAGGEEAVSAGGTDSGASVFSGGALYASGTVSAATVFSGGVTYLSGGTAYATLVEGGLTLGSGGVASLTLVESGGSDYISGGTGSLTTVMSAGAETVISGGAAYGTVIQSGGAQFVSAGGAASNTVVSNGGIAEIDAGGRGIGITLSAGGMELNNAGNAAGSIVQSGGQAVLFNGGADTQSVISRGGVEIVSSGGVSNEATIRSGGVEIVLSSGTARNTIIDSGGSLVLLPGAADPGVLRLAGGKIDTTGVVLVNPGSAAGIHATSAAGLSVQAGGTAYVLAGGTAESAQLNGTYTKFATMTVFAGGDAAATAINSGGEVFVQSGAQEYGAQVANAGFLTLAGTGSEDALNAGATMFLQSGGIAFGTEINGGARQFDGPGGEALAANVAYGGAQLVSGGTAFGTEIASGGTQYVDSGGVAYQSVDAGQEILSSGAAGYGATLANGTLILLGGSEFTGTLAFSSFGGTLVIDTAIPTAAEIANFGQGDTIALNQLAYDPSARPEVLNPGTLIVAPGISLDIEGAVSGSQFVFVDNNGETEITAAVPCFAEGTRILTPAGDVEVERLRVGGHVITEAGEDAPIIWIGRRTILLEAHPEPATAQPIRIAAHSFGHGLPVRDLLLSPDHAVLCGGVLVPAKALVNGANITQLRRRMVTYYHVELAEHSIIFAENLAVESFLDTGNRQGFENAASGPARPYAEALAMRLRDSCAPLAEAGAHVVKVRHATARRYYQKQAVAF